MSILGLDLAVDLGAARTRIYVKRKGIVLDEPSAVVRDARTGKIVEYGAEGDPAGGHETCWPVSAGLPADGELTRRLVRHFLRKVHRRPFAARPHLVMALPEGATPIDRAALRDVAYDAEARGLLLVPHGLAAALGAGVQVRDGIGRMVIDIGRDVARVAVLSHGAVVASATVPVGGRAMNLAIARMVEREHGLLLDEAEAEEAKRRAGTDWKPLQRHVTVQGRDAETGRERVVSLPVQLIYEATRQPVEAIVRAAVGTVEGCPPELVADLGERGAVLVGGGALLRGLGRRLRAALCMPVRRAERPLYSVALGLGRCVEDHHLVNRLKSIIR
ncbi:rod shape-determining protein [Nonomuraea wenchangensis]|uniref:Rod shape-determining protein MreB n=1 Tax=Nonomuraea wenchangensis TaxID=568860 RepID=A0A1I0CRQ4_9ACTN|nr:rod shape-determining protein [Nonomuraea wenchangensis]SET22421.1 rod shape-determining protein MreB [Nonomuraea wenchangensis]